jgi:hypothetical protein
MPLVEQELLTLPEHLTSSPILSGVRVTSIYGFWLPLSILRLFYQSLTPEVFRVFMLFYPFVVQYVTLTLFCLSVMVSTVPVDLKNILMGTATRRNDQEWTNFKLHEPCEPHGLSSGVCVCCSIDPSSVPLLLFVFMCQNCICWCRPHSCSEKNQHKTYYIHGINCISRR